MSTYRFTPANPDGTGDLFLDDQPLPNAAPQLASPEMAIGRDDTGGMGQPLATGVTMVADAVSRSGHTPDHHRIYQALRTVEPHELGSLLGQRRTSEWDLPAAEVDRWARDQGLI